MNLTPRASRLELDERSTYNYHPIISIGTEKPFCCKHSSISKDSIDHYGPCCRYTKKSKWTEVSQNSQGLPQTIPQCTFAQKKVNQKIKYSSIKEFRLKASSWNSNAYISSFFGDLFALVSRSCAMGNEYVVVTADKIVTALALIWFYISLTINIKQVIIFIYNS